MIFHHEKTSKRQPPLTRFLCYIQCMPLLDRASPELRLSRTAEHILDLMRDHLFDRGAGRSQILTRVKMAGVLRHIFTDRSRHRNTDIRINVNLADCHSSRLAEHFLGNTDCVRHRAAILVDHLN